MIKKLILAVLLLGTVNFYAQDSEPDDSDLAKKIQNPIANLISIPFQNNYDFGEDIRPTNTLNIQPVYPFSLGENVNFITRTIVPIVSAPVGSDRIQGVGNIIFSGYFTPAKASKLIWGVGPSIMFPTIEKGLGFDKLGLAPSGIVIYQSNGWTIGGILQNFWGIAGNSNNDLNFFYSQVFVVKNLKKGWYVNSAPIMTANWDAPGERRWTVPVGAGAGKLFKVGKLPINGQVGFYKFIESATGADYQIRAQVVFLFPK